MHPLIHTAIGPADLWRTWTLEAGVVLPMIAALLGYALGLQRVWARAGQGRGVRRWQARCFAAGCTVLALALISPLHALGGSLFSAHMTQHVLIMGVAAPLLVLGAPLTVFTWALPRQGRRAVSRVVAGRTFRSTWHLATAPLVAWLVHAAAIWTWHLPPLYSATIESELVHGAQHASFFAAALLFWWAVRERARHGLAVPYLFTTAVHSSMLGALLAFAPAAWYAPYERTAPLWGLSALEDQQLGGLIMWVPAGLVYIGAALALLASWLRTAERRAGRAAVAGLCALMLAGCSAAAQDERALRKERGRAAIVAYGCGACHEIDGVRGANGRVGPPLNGVADRVYIAGYLPNQPDVMVQWIMVPQAFRQPTAMPNLGVSEQEARDMTAYLYSLR